MNIFRYFPLRLPHLVLCLCSLLLLPLSQAEEGHAHKEETGHGGDDQKASHAPGEEEHGKEGVLELSSDVLKNSGVTIEEARQTTLKVTLQLTGKLLPNEDKVAHVVPRFPGIIREVRKRLGDSVEKGEVLAVIESNSTIQQYEVRPLLSGVITKRHATLGEFAADNAELFVVSDYGELFADLFVYPTDAVKVSVGQKALVIVPGRKNPIESIISFISPIVDADNQSRFVRVVVSNPKGQLQPGSFVTAGIVTEEAPVSVAVETSAIQSIEGKTQLFVQEQDHLKVRPVLVGRNDLQYTEILSGLAAGEKYASGNTFILKAELGKSEAEHEH